MEPYIIDAQMELEAAANETDISSEETIIIPTTQEEINVLQTPNASYMETLLEEFLDAHFQGQAPGDEVGSTETPPWGLVSGPLPTVEHQVRDFKNILLSTGALIAGGAVLSAIQKSVTGLYRKDVKKYDPIPANLCAPTWQTSDIDIYVHQSRLHEIIEFLVDIKFNVLTVHTAPPYDTSFFRRNNIKGRVALFRPREHHSRSLIDVMIIPDEIPLLRVIENFDLTFCSVWYDGRTINGSDLEGAVEKRGELRHDYVLSLLNNFNKFIVNRLKKYRSRGYSTAKIYEGILNTRKAGIDDQSAAEIQTLNESLTNNEANLENLIQIFQQDNLNVQIRAEIRHTQRNIRHISREIKKKNANRQKLARVLWQEQNPLMNPTYQNLDKIIFDTGEIDYIQEYWVKLAELGEEGWRRALTIVWEKIQVKLEGQFEGEELLPRLNIERVDTLYERIPALIKSCIYATQLSVIHQYYLAVILSSECIPLVLEWRSRNSPYMSYIQRSIDFEDFEGGYNQWMSPWVFFWRKKNISPEHIFSLWDNDFSPLGIIKPVSLSLFSSEKVEYRDAMRQFYSVIPIKLQRIIYDETGLRDYCEIFNTGEGESAPEEQGEDDEEDKEAEQRVRRIREIMTEIKDTQDIQQAVRAAREQAEEEGREFSDEDARELGHVPGKILALMQERNQLTALNAEYIGKNKQKEEENKRRLVSEWNQDQNNFIFVVPSDKTGENTWTPSPQDSIICFDMGTLLKFIIAYREYMLECVGRYLTNVSQGDRGTADYTSAYNVGDKVMIRDGSIGPAPVADMQRGTVYTVENVYDVDEFLVNERVFRLTREDIDADTDYEVLQGDDIVVGPGVNLSQLAGGVYYHIISPTGLTNISHGEPAGFGQEFVKLASDLQTADKSMRMLQPGEEGYPGIRYIGIPINTDNLKVYVDSRQVKEMVELYDSGVRIFYLTPTIDDDGTEKSITHTVSYKNAYGDNPNFVSTNHCQYKSSILCFDIRINMGRGSQALQISLKTLYNPDLA